MDENLDLSKAFEKVQNMLSDENGEGQLQNLLGMLTGGGANNSETEDSSNSSGFDLSSLFSNENSNDPSGGFDLNTIMKIQGIMSAVNSQKPDKSSAFLSSLKPFLKKERRNKLDQATKIINATKAFKLFKEIDKGGN